VADRLLLDTHVVLWWLFDSPNLTDAVDDLVRSASEVRVSAASAWEVAIKQGLGRLEVPEPLEDAVRRSGFVPIAVTFDHAQALTRIPSLHRDPFDRLLVAVALAEGLTLVTADEAVLAYPVPSFDARS
jgi:PIN domain nuclease of toxin-antitoxin system